MNDVCDIWSSPWRTLHRSAPPAAAERQQTVWQQTVWQEAAPGTSSWLGRARLAAALKTRMRSAPAPAL